MNINLDHITMRPDLMAIGVFFVRALGPALVFILALVILHIKMKTELKEILTIIAVVGIFWSFPFLFFLTRRLLYKLSLSYDGGAIRILENGSFFNRKKDWSSECCFRIVRINTLGYLPRIEDSNGFQFGQLLSCRQQELVLAWMKRSPHVHVQK